MLGLTTRLFQGRVGAVEFDRVLDAQSHESVADAGRQVLNQVSDAQA